MYEQKLKEHAKAYDNQQKQLTAMKKSGKSGKQATEELKNKMTVKQNKMQKGKKGPTNIGDEGPWVMVHYWYIGVKNRDFFSENIILGDDGVYCI